MVYVSRASNARSSTIATTSFLLAVLFVMLICCQAEVSAQRCSTGLPTQRKGKEEGEATGGGGGNCIVPMARRGRSRSREIDLGAPISARGERARELRSIRASALSFTRGLRSPQVRGISRGITTRITARRTSDVLRLAASSSSRSETKRRPQAEKASGCRHRLFVRHSARHSVPLT